MSTEVATGVEGEGMYNHIGMSAEHHNCNNRVVADNPTMCGSYCIRKVGYPSGIRDEAVEGEENGNEDVNKIDGSNNQVQAAVAAAVEVRGDGPDTDNDCAVDNYIDLNAALAVLEASRVADLAVLGVSPGVVDLAVLGVSGVVDLAVLGVSDVVDRVLKTRDVNAY